MGSAALSALGPLCQSLMRSHRCWVSGTLTFFLGDYQGSARWLLESMLGVWGMRREKSSGRLVVSTLYVRDAMCCSMSRAIRTLIALMTSDKPCRLLVWNCLYLLMLILLRHFCVDISEWRGSVDHFFVTSKEYKEPAHTLPGNSIVDSDYIKYRKHTRSINDGIRECKS